MPQQSVSPYNPRSISLAVHYVQSASPGISAPKVSFQIISCTKLLTLGPIVPRSPTCLHSLDDIVMWNALSICHICPPEVEKVLLWSIDNCIVCWPCCLAICWMLQDMDHMEATCIIDVKVHMFDQLEQTKIWVWTVISFGIVSLTARYVLILSVCFL